MAVTTVADVLRTAESFEGKLVDYYTGVAERSTREGVKLLTDYMGRHRRRLAEAIDRLEPSDRARICAFPIRYEPLAPDCSSFEDRELPPDAPASEILDIAIELDGCLIDLYRQVLMLELDQEVADLFESLVRAEERDAIELKKIKAMDYF
ncbi:MAG: hypothetical protein ABIG03_05675 [Candidatus Eisenbacteria bacterium]